MKKYILYTKSEYMYSGFITDDCIGKPHCSSRFIHRAYQFSSQKDAQQAQAYLCSPTVIMTYTEGKKLLKKIFTAMSKTTGLRESRELAEIAEREFFSTSNSKSLGLANVKIRFKHLIKV